MPAIQYWISGTSFYLAGSFVFVVFVALIGIREMISRKSFIIFVAVALIFAILAWWTAAKQEKENTELRNILNSIGQTAPIIEALRRSENALHGQEQATAIIRRILNQYDRLLEGISVFEQITGVKNEANRRASAEHIISELRAMISGNVQLMGTPNGQALILKTAPNTFRITFSVPMRIAPNITFHGLPTGVTANILEKTNIGVTVVFTPSTIPVEAFPPSEFSADF